MSPRSLLFSSDPETSRQINCALQALELSVEACPEIFAALKILTTKTINVIVVDWDEGLEAGFLLKTAHELRSNRNIFAVVLGHPDARAALEQAGADLVLSKPLRSEQVIHDLLNCAAFKSRFKSWASASLARQLACSFSVDESYRSQWDAALGKRGSRMASSNRCNTAVETRPERGSHSS